VLVIFAAITVFLSMVAIVSPAQGAPDGRPHVRVLGPGVAITTYVDRRVPIRAYVLTVDPSQGASIGIALSNDKLAGLEQTTAMAKRLGAVAAVNGDFGYTSGRPVHPFALGGDLVQTSNALGVLFTIAADGTMGIQRSSQEQVAVTEVDSGKTWPIATWNDGRPGPGEMTSASPTADGTTRSYSVDQSGCYSSSLSPGEGVVLSAAPTTDEGTFLRSLSPGESMQIDWSLGSPGSWTRSAAIGCS
jgi:hypothetical protein